MNPPGLISLHAVTRAGPSLDLWAAAAVRETYRPDSLLANWLHVNPQTTPERQREAVRATLELQTIGIASTDVAGCEAMRLPTDTRLSILGKIGAGQSLRALGAVPNNERTMTERALASLLADEPIPIDRDDRMQLNALQTASGWAKAAGAAPTVNLEDIAQHLRRVDFLQLLGGGDLHRFVGRGAILRMLNRLWRSDESPSKEVLVEGPGGIGKSLTVSRFIADLLESDDPQLRPDVVFHLDFDRLSLQRARASTILNELVQQGRRWCGPDRIDELKELTQLVMAGGSDLEGVSDSPRSSESVRDNSYAVIGLLRVIAPTKARPRVLVFVDSFEQVDSIDDVAADSPRKVVGMFVDEGADVLTIYASRAFVRKERLGDPPIVRLKQFTVPEADAYLSNEASRVGVEINKRIATEVRNAVGRSPLALRLAVGLLEKNDESFDVTQWGTLAREAPEVVQAALYDRLLRRIRNPQLRKIAVPGLLVRRLTSEVIEQVLSKPCGLDLALTSSADLMWEARREGQLFLADDSDEGALWHRQDVRATMLANLERSTDPELIRVINENAVRFYKGQKPSLVFRTEELYHRLRLNQPTDVLDDRWSEAAGLALRPALQEFPSAARAYLRHKMGAASAEGSTLNPKVRAVHPVGTKSVRNDQVEEFRLLARKVLQSGEPVDAILDQWKADGMRLDVPLGDVYAEALFRKGWHEQLLSSARDLLTAPTPKVDPKAVSAVMSITAALLEGRSALSDAQSFWFQALRAADLATDPHTVLGCLVGSTRIRRKLNTGSEKRALEFERALALVEELAASISERRVLAREVTAELGEALIGQRRYALPDLQRLMTFLAEVNEAFPSAVNNPARVEQLNRRLFGITGNVSLRTLNSYLQKLVYDGDEAMRRLVTALREEVDWSLSHAILVQSSRNPADLSSPSPRKLRV